MRVVLATNSSDRGSTSRTLEAWARLLPLQGIEPHVTIGGAGPLLGALQSADVPTDVRSLKVIPEWRWPLPFGLAVARFAATLRSSRAQLVHANEHEFHLVPAYAARLTHIPIVTHLRFRPTAEMCAWLFGRGRMPARIFFTSRTQMADSADAMRPAVPEDRWRLIPNGLDFSTFGVNYSHRDRLRREWQLDPDTIAIGTACAISERKRVDHLIRLVARLRARGVKVCGVIAGQPHFPSDRALVEELRKLAHDLGVGDIVRFLGYVEPVEPLYYAWDICVSTSSYETFGMTVLESMACRCPVIAYPGGSVGEVLGDAGCVVPDTDEDALFDTALKLATDDHARQLLGERGRARAERTFDIRTIVPLLAREYREVVASDHLAVAPTARQRKKAATISVVFSTNSRDRGSTSRTLETWTTLLPEFGIRPTVTLGGEGPLLDAFRTARTPATIRPLGVVPNWHHPAPFALAVARLAATLKKSRAAILHINEHEFHLVPSHAARLAGIPFVTHVRFRPSRQMADWIFRGTRRPARLFFTSRTQMHDCADAVRPTVPEEDWRLIPDGLDFSKWGHDRSARARLRRAWGLDDDTVAVGTASAISDRKRLDHFVRLIARLRASGLNIVGFLAGDAHLPSDRALVQDLRQLAIDLGVADSLRFLGYVEPVEPLYYAWDLLLSTSAYETFGMSVIEAMSCRCPVLAYPGGSVAEVLADAGSVVPDGNEDALFDEARRLVVNREAAMALGERGRRHAEHTYDLGHVVPKLAAEYRAVIAES